MPAIRRATRTLPHAPGLVARVAVGRVLRRAAGRAIDTATGPAVGGRAEVATDPAALLGDLLPEVPGSKLASWTQEHRSVERDLIARADGRALPLPSAWRTEHGTGLVLYALVRSLRPSTVVETGTANGWSTVLLLRALAANGAGHLHSFDVRRDVGALVDPEERGRWTLHVLPRGTPAAFSRALSRLDPPDLFFHDSDHSYLHMRLELRTAARRLAPGGVLASDDAQASHAYVEACEELGVRPHLLLDGHKASGFARR